MRFQKVYVEITNVCNLQCSFCHGTIRTPRFLSVPEFEQIAEKLRGSTQYLYFHLMGEPLLHPELAQFLGLAGELEYYVNLTTNGILLPTVSPVLLNASSLHRINLSLQCWEANQMTQTLESYISACGEFARAASEHGVLVSLRLWNGGGAELRNAEILELLHDCFPGPWKTAQKNTVLSDRVFLEFGERFDWPDRNAPRSGATFCRGLRDQIGILCDGSVVPCCLDSDGSLTLGNLFEQDLDSILSSPRAVAIYEGFSRRTPAEELCKRCGYAARF